MFTPHLRGFTLPGKPTPWLMEGLEAWRLVETGEGAAGVVASFTGEPWEPVVHVRVYAPPRRVGPETVYRHVLGMLRVDFDYSRFLGRLREVA